MLLAKISLPTIVLACMNYTKLVVTNYSFSRKELSLCKGIHPNQYGFIKNVITNEYIGVKYANTQSRILREFMVPYNELLWEL